MNEEHIKLLLNFILFGVVLVWGAVRLKASIARRREAEKVSRELDDFVRKHQIPGIVSYTESLWKKRMGFFLNVVLIAYFVLFMIPESFWSKFFEIPGKEYYPDIILRMVEKSSFPASAQVLLSMTPVFMLAVFVLVTASIWPVYELKECIKRRENGNKVLGMFVAAIVMAVGLVFIVIYDDNPGRKLRSLEPFQSKLGFFFIFAGMPLIFSIGLSGIVIEFRARFFLRKNQENKLSSG